MNAEYYVRQNQNKMAYVLRLFFSFSGKIKRSEFWLATLGLWITAGIGAAMFENSDGILILIILTAVWSGVAIQVKRWHDRNKSGLWVLINIIPYIGPIWSLVELGFIPGKEAPKTENSAKTEHSEEYKRQRREAEFREQERRKMAEEEARKAQEEYARRKAHADEQRANEERSVPPPLPEEIRFARALGLNGKVSKDDIKKRYRDLAHKYHPDKVSHLGDEFKELAQQKFREINEAYEYFRRKYEIS